MEDPGRNLAPTPPAVPSFVPVLQRLGRSGFGHLVEAASRKSIGDIKNAFARLQAHLAGFHAWQRHCHGRGAGVYRGKLFCCAFSVGIVLGAPVSALKFVAALLGCDRFLANLASPVVAVWSGLGIQIGRRARKPCCCLQSSLQTLRWQCTIV